jgi:serine/threonine protein kinase
LRWYYLVI